MRVTYGCIIYFVHLIMKIADALHSTRSINVLRYQYQLRAVKSTKAINPKLNEESKPETSSVEEKKILVIVESPAKAKTIQKFIDSDKYVVKYSAGHIRDLIKSSKQASEKMRSEYVSRELGLRIYSLGVDIHKNFEPIYAPLANKIELIKSLADLVKSSTSIILATDEDREGEAIAWHLFDTLKPPPNMPVKRAVFNEITKSAIVESFQKLRDIDTKLVEAQETRRILDRLTGYTLSPILWRYIHLGLSAGRVQSCGLKLVVERERKRWAFISASYFSVLVTLSDAEKLSSAKTVLQCKLHTVNGVRVAGERDFDDNTGKLCAASSGAAPLLLSHEWTRWLLAWLTGADPLATEAGSNKPDTGFKYAQFEVSSLEAKSIRRNPPPAFITSSLQQEASKKLGLSPAQTMSIAQKLYEGGFITYHRTDSPKLSDNANKIARSLILDQFGASYLSESSSRSNKKKISKLKAVISSPPNAQEAHEAIRPAEIKSELGAETGGFFTPEHVPLAGIDRAMFTMIYQRTLASLMAQAVSDTITYTVTATRKDSLELIDLASFKQTINDVEFRSSSTVPVFRGYLAVYDKYAIDSVEIVSNKKHPKLKQHQQLWLTNIVNTQCSFDAEEGDDNDTFFTEAEENEPKNDLVVPGVVGKQHITRPPPRYTEASFVKQMEAAGVGRPSTYASIIQTLRDREYLIVDKHTLIPTVKGVVVTRLLEKHFSEIVDVEFTASMENQLDAIAKGERNKLSFLKEFYLGNGMGENKHRDGLLNKAVDIVRQGKIDQNKSRRVELPFLEGLDCHLSVSSSGLVVERREGIVGSRWILPTAMQLDIRLLTKEAIEHVISTQLTTEGTFLKTENESQTISIRSGPYGKYLQLSGNDEMKKTLFSLPEWVDTSRHSNEQILAFTKLPKEICFHPLLKVPIFTQVTNKQLSLRPKDFPIYRYLPEGTMVEDVDQSMVIELFNDIDEKTWNHMFLGMHEGFPVTLLPTKSSSKWTLRWKNITTLLGQKQIEGLSLEDALTHLQAKGREWRIRETKLSKTVA